MDGYGNVSARFLGAVSAQLPWPGRGHLYVFRGILVLSCVVLCLTSNAQGTSEDTWASARNEAEQYRNGEKPERVKLMELYSNVLSSSPPPEVELHVRLTMGGLMTICYDPELGEESLDQEAIKWYESLLRDFSDLSSGRDFSTHHDLMIAKIHLGQLYIYVAPGGEDGKRMAEHLLLEAVEVPEDEIVFDDPDMAELNTDNIAVAKAPAGRGAVMTDSGDVQMMGPSEEMNTRHRSRLLKQRQVHTNALRRAAIRALAYSQYKSGGRTVTLERLGRLKEERTDDQVYQETLDKVIEQYSSSYHADILEDEIDTLVDEAAQ